MQIRYVEDWLWSTWLIAGLVVHEVLGLGVLVSAWAGCYLIRPSGSQPFSHFAFAYTKHEIPLAKFHDTRDSPCEITRHTRFPLRDYTKHKIPCEITRNTRFPVKLHETRESPCEITKHEIPRAKLHETRDSPCKITPNTWDSPREITRKTRSLFGIIPYQFRKIIYTGNVVESLHSHRNNLTSILWWCREGDGEFWQFIFAGFVNFSLCEVKSPPPAPPNKQIKIHGYFVQTQFVRYRTWLLPPPPPPPPPALDRYAGFHPQFCWYGTTQRSSSVRLNLSNLCECYTSNVHTV